MQRHDNGTLIAIVLAAGLGKRFGSTKQLAEFRGKPLVRQAVEAVSAAGQWPVVLVAGNAWQSVHDAAETDFLIVNERYAEGLGTSIAAAASAIGHAADALLFCLADQPLIPPAHYRALAQAFDGHPDSIVATKFGDSTGAPALFGRGHCDGLSRLSGDRGARALFEDAGQRLVTVECCAALSDVDTPDDLEALR